MLPFFFSFLFPPTLHHLKIKALVKWEQWRVIRRDKMLWEFGIFILHPVICFPVTLHYINTRITPSANTVGFYLLGSVRQHFFFILGIFPLYVYSRWNIVFNKNQEQVLPKPEKAMLSFPTFILYCLCVNCVNYSIFSLLVFIASRYLL